MLSDLPFLTDLHGSLAEFHHLGPVRSQDQSGQRRTTPVTYYHGGTPPRVWGQLPEMHPILKGPGLRNYLQRTQKVRILSSRGIVHGIGRLLQMPADAGG